MLEDGLEVVLVAEREDEVGLVNHQNLERVFERQVPGLDVGNDARRNSDDDVRKIADEKLLLSLDAFDVGNVDATNDSAATVGQLITKVEGA
jgi:hypothetical protein